MEEDFRARRLAQRLVVTLERCKGCETHQHCTKHQVRYVCRFPRCSTVCANETSWKLHNKRQHGNRAPHNTKTKYDEYHEALFSEMHHRFPGITVRELGGSARLGAFEVSAAFADGTPIPYHYSKIETQKWPCVKSQVEKLFNCAQQSEARTKAHVHTRRQQQQQQQEHPFVSSSTKKEKKLTIKTEAEFVAELDTLAEVEGFETASDAPSDHGKGMQEAKQRDIELDDAYENEWVEEEATSSIGDEKESKTPSIRSDVEQEEAREDIAQQIPPCDPAALFLDVSALLDAGGSISSDSSIESAYTGVEEEELSEGKNRDDDSQAGTISEADSTLSLT